jgi:hypothetical protein
MPFGFMKTNIKYYVLRVWLTSVILSPVLVWLYYTCTDGSAPNAELILLMLVWGSGLSLPSVLFLGMFCHYLVFRKNNVKEVKIWLTLIGIILTYAPFFILNAGSFTDHSGVSALFWPYGVTIVAGVWFYRLTGIGHSNMEQVKR